jgi:hypothetical protein
MKAKELIEILEENPDFDVCFSLYKEANISGWNRLEYQYMADSHIDTGYSDGVIKIEIVSTDNEN